VVGALLVTISVVGTFAYSRSGTDGPTTEYLVVVSDVEAGQEIELADVELEVMSLPPGAATNALRSASGLDGATALRPLRAGSVLDVRDLKGAAVVDGVAITGVHELTIPIPADRAPATVRRGDRVTLLAYSNSDGVLHTAIEDALVLGFEADPAGIGSSGDARLTLALPDAEDAARVTRWSYQALTVVLTTRDLVDVYPAVVTPPGTTLEFRREQT
jgi:hypothetical protein